MHIYIYIHIYAYIYIYKGCGTCVNANVLCIVPMLTDDPLLITFLLYECVNSSRRARTTRALVFVLLFTLLDVCVSSLRRGHANVLCIVPMLTDGPRWKSWE